MKKGRCRPDQNGEAESRSHVRICNECYGQSEEVRNARRPIPVHVDACELLVTRYELPVVKNWPAVFDQLRPSESLTSSNVGTDAPILIFSADLFGNCSNESRKSQKTLFLIAIHARKR